MNSLTTVSQCSMLATILWGLSPFARMRKLLDLSIQIYLESRKNYKQHLMSILCSEKGNFGRKDFFWKEDFAESFCFMCNQTDLKKQCAECPLALIITMNQLSWNAVAPKISIKKVVEVAHTLIKMFFCFYYRCKLIIRVR